MSLADAAELKTARDLRELNTPEGVNLKLELADAGERASAFLIDGLLIVAVLIGMTLLAVVGFAAFRGQRQSAEAVAVIWLLGFFVLRNFWFAGFELSPRAATPGKRLMKLRVARRDGSRLTADAVFARNAMREIEVFLPVSFLLANAQGVDAWTALLGLGWTGIFLLFPLFNRDRLRVGDLVAGTCVVRSPRRKLAGDLTELRPSERVAFGFTTAQLDAYGVHELQVLETVLRRNEQASVKLVAERIRARIGWAAGPSESDGAFLEAYYAALRARLEGRLLLGRRRRDKFDVG